MILKPKIYHFLDENNLLCPKQSDQNWGGDISNTEEYKNNHLQSGFVGFRGKPLRFNYSYLYTKKLYVYSIVNFTNMESNNHGST